MALANFPSCRVPYTKTFINLGYKTYEERDMTEIYS